MSDAVEQAMAEFDAREAARDAIEADPHMVGSPAWAAYYWENGGEYPDGTHPLDHEEN